MTPPNSAETSTEKSTNTETITATKVRQALVGMIAAPLGWVLVLPILSRVLGVNGRGEVAAGVAPFMLISAVGALGVPETLVYISGQQPGSLRRAARLGRFATVVIGAAATGIAFALAPVLAQGRPHLTSLIELGSLAIVPTLLVSVSRGIAMGRHDWKRVRREQVFASAVALVSVTTLAALGHLTPESATIAMTFGPVVGGVVYLAGPKPPCPGPLSGSDQFSLRRFVDFALKTWAGNLTGLALVRLDQVIMTPLTDPRQLGLYVLAVNIGEIPVLLNAAVSIVSYSSQATTNDHESLARASRVSLSACALTAAAIAGVSWFAVPLIFGAGFRASVPAVLLLLISSLVGAPGSLAGGGLASRGRPGLRSATLALSAAVDLAVLLALLPHFGFIGAAIAMVAASLIGSSTMTWLYSREAQTPVRDLWVPRLSDVRRTPIPSADLRTAKQ